MTNDQRPTRNTPEGDTPRPGVPRTPATRRRPTTGLDDSIREVAWRLEPRDFVLALLLDEHRTLTTSQITSILFTSPRTCRNRLDILRSIGWIDWFIPVRHGRRLPAHWVPGPLSARYAALRRGDKAPNARAVRELQDRTVAIAHLAHTDGTNQFFIDLLAHTRHHRNTRLTRWWSAARTASAMGSTMRPDGHGVWRDGDREVAFFLEFDTGEETHRQLADKLPAYRHRRAQGGPAWPVLFWLPTTVRETHLHKHLAATAPGVTVATAARDTAAAHSPAGPVWRLLGNGRRRLHLADLPSPPGQPGPYPPGPPTPDEDPLHLLDAD